MTRQIDKDWRWKGGGQVEGDREREKMSEWVERGKE